jgi:hypothetical protein
MTLTWLTPAAITADATNLRDALGLQVVNFCALRVSVPDLPCRVTIRGVCG